MPRKRNLLDYNVILPTDAQRQLEFRLNCKLKRSYYNRLRKYFSGELSMPELQRWLANSLPKQKMAHHKLFLASILIASANKASTSKNSIDEFLSEVIKDSGMIYELSRLPYVDLPEEKRTEVPTLPQLASSSHCTSSSPRAGLNIKGSVNIRRSLRQSSRNCQTEQFIPVPFDNGKKNSNHKLNGEVEFESTKFLNGTNKKSLSTLNGETSVEEPECNCGNSKETPLKGFAHDHSRNASLRTLNGLNHHFPLKINGLVANSCGGGGPLVVNRRRTRADLLSSNCNSVVTKQKCNAAHSSSKFVDVSECSNSSYESCVSDLSNSWRSNLSNGDCAGINRFGSRSQANVNRSCYDNNQSCSFSLTACNNKLVDNPKSRLRSHSRSSEDCPERVHTAAGPETNFSRLDSVRQANKCTLNGNGRRLGEHDAHSASVASDSINPHSVRLSNGFNSTAIDQPVIRSRSRSSVSRTDSPICDIGHRHDTVPGAGGSRFPCPFCSCVAFPCKESRWNHCLRRHRHELFEEGTAGLKNGYPLRQTVCRRAAISEIKTKTESVVPVEEKCFTISKPVFELGGFGKTTRSTDNNNCGPEFRLNGFSNHRTVSESNHSESGSEHSESNRNYLRPASDVTSSSSEYDCPFCLTSFPDKSEWWRHQRDQHREEIFEDSVTSCQLRKKRHKYLPPYHAAHGNSSFPPIRKSDVRPKVGTRFPAPPKPTVKNGTIRSDEKHQSHRLSRKSRFCEDCDHEFYSPNGLRRHLRNVHHLDIPYCSS